MKKSLCFKGMMLLIALFMGISSVSMAQSQRVKVKGKVCDPDMNAIIACQVMEKGTTNSTIADLDGYFELTVSMNSMLVFMCNGYVTAEISVKDFLAAQGNYLVIILEEDNLPEEPEMNFYDQLFCCVEIRR